MNREEKLKYTELALRLLGYKFTKTDIDTIVSICELITEKKGNTDIKAILQLEIDIKNRDNDNKI
jgi:hypothetical protein